MSKTPGDRIRDAAWALDNLDRVCQALYEPIARGHVVNAGEVTVTINLTNGDGWPMSGEDAVKMLAWVGGDIMQRDLRAIADVVDAANIDVPLPEPDRNAETA